MPQDKMCGYRAPTAGERAAAKATADLINSAFDAPKVRLKLSIRFAIAKLLLDQNARTNVQALRKTYAAWLLEQGLAEGSDMPVDVPEAINELISAAQFTVEKQGASRYVLGIKLRK
jgi:hypothetical protein